MRYLLAALSALISFSAFAVEDRVPPEVKSLRFTPETIQTGTKGADVTVDFTLSDDSSGVTFFEVTFIDPAGVMRRSATLKFAPTLSVTSSATITFPPFSTSGTWTLSQLFLSDAAGNTLVLGADALSGRGFPTRLEVVAVKDTTSPKLAALAFTPAQIDTSAGPADVRVDYTVTDDLSGVAYLELAFVNSSGIVRRGGSVKFDPLQSISRSMTVTFPTLSEAGLWTLSVVFLADAAGNSLMLNAEALAGMGIPTTLEVKSVSDTIRPALTALRIVPHSINIAGGPVTVKVEFTATDDLSGVKSVHVTFVSPSGAGKVSGSVVLIPAKVVTGSIDLRFPPESQRGQWTLAPVLLADAAGNTLVVGAEDLTRLGFQASLEVR